MTGEPGLQGQVRSRVDDTVVLRVVRDERGNWPFVRLDGRRTRLELLGHVVV